VQELLADFHVHTAQSDGQVPLLEVIDIFGKGGVKVINISDHLYDTITEHGKRVHEMKQCIQDWELYCAQVEKARRYAEQRYGMLVIRGAEITRADSGDGTAGFHIVAVDLKEPVNPNLSPQEIVKAIQAQGGLAISAHPYDKPDAGPRGNVFYLWENLEAFRDMVDLWEIGNGRVLYEKVAQEGLRFVADSDFHIHIDSHDAQCLSQFFSWKTKVAAKRNKDAVKEALLKQKVSLVLVNKTPG